MGAYNDNVLFVHIPKCGGWSVKKYMQEHLPGVLMPDNPDSKLPIGHVRLQDIERFTGRAPESFKRIIAVVRNPYEQQLSQYCYWATRFAKGGRHVHDCATALYVRWENVLPSKVGWDDWQWRPEHVDLAGWLSDPRSDFHCWYLQHWGYEPGMTPQEQRAVRLMTEKSPDGQNRYEEFGGLFRFWVTVDGEIPENVCILRQECLSEQLPAALKPFVDHALPEPPTLNTSSHLDDPRHYYNPTAAALVEQKCGWAFREYYNKWLLSDFAA